MAATEDRCALKGGRGRGEGVLTGAATEAGGVSRQGGLGDMSHPAQKNTRKAPIHLHLSPAISALTFSELTSEKFSWRLTGCQAGRAAEPRL